MSITIADISHHNDVKFLDKNEIDGVIIRATYGSQSCDKKVKQHVEMAEKAGLPYGFYHFSYACSMVAARKNAENFLDVISDYNPTLPCFIDMEKDNENTNLLISFKPENKEAFTEIAKIQLHMLEKAGYYAGLYGNEYDLMNITSDKDLRKRYGLWVANWTKEPDKEKFPTKILWQNTSKGRVNGIEGNVDLSIGDISFLQLVDKMNNIKNCEPKPVGDFIVNGCKVTTSAVTDIYGTHLAGWVNNVVLTVLKINTKDMSAIISSDGKTPTAEVSVETLKRYY